MRIPHSFCIENIQTKNLLERKVIYTAFQYNPIFFRRKAHISNSEKQAKPMFYLTPQEYTRYITAIDERIAENPAYIHLTAKHQGREKCV